MYNKEKIFDKYKCRITLDALSSIRKKIIVKILWILISLLNNNSYRLSPSWEPLPYKISSRDIIDMLNVRWSSIPIENYQLARNYAEGERASEIFPRKCRCRKKKGGERRESGWFHGFVWWKSCEQGMPRGLIRKRLDWFDSKANNATSCAWWNSGGCRRD